MPPLNTAPCIFFDNVRNLAENHLMCSGSLAVDIDSEKDYKPANQFHVEVLDANKKLEADCRHLESRNQDNTRYFENQLQTALAKINELEADRRRLLNVQKQKNMEIQGLTVENEGFKGQLEIQRVELAKLNKASSGIKELEAISADFCSREDQKEFQLETEDFTKKSVEQQTQLQRAYHTIKALEAKCENLLQREELEEVQTFSYSTVTEATDTFVDKAYRKCEEVKAGQIREIHMTLESEVDCEIFTFIRFITQWIVNENNKNRRRGGSFSKYEHPTATRMDIEGNPEHSPAHMVKLTGEEIVTARGRFHVYQIFKNNVGEFTMVARYGVRKPWTYVDIRGKDRITAGDFVRGR
ncbi:hypothetical protein B0H14DRAFT_2635827 [Mycena olivaceomarginata]|nr:hypothetical protein B0H14DRAFT_2635827 [Mycena olivaceomarginata]